MRKIPAAGVRGADRDGHPEDHGRAAGARGVHRRRRTCRGGQPGRRADAAAGPLVNDARSLPAQVPQRQEWVRQPERGSLALLRTLKALSLRWGRPASRVLLYLVIVYFWLRPGPAGGHIARFQQRALARRPTRRDLFLQLRAFATCTHDRVFLLNDRLTDFSVEITNEQVLAGMLKRGTGCFLMGAHFGSFEMLRAVGEQYPEVKVAMVMYPENARKI